MLFDSSIFVGFYSLFVLCYFLVRRSLSLRNGLVVVGSFIFYGYWDFRFLILLVLTASLDFFIALRVDRAKNTERRVWVAMSIIINLAILGLFKYSNFFVESFRDLVALFGVRLDTITMEILLPVGISFYTFQSISYVIDVYRGDIRPTKNLVEFLAYISFFPQLVAGPVERAGHLLPQFQTLRIITADQVRDGIGLILVGLFKKIVLADNLAPFVQLAYEHPDPGAGLIIAGTIAFAFQIYCDFSGYSDIARGTAQLIGFELMRNFNLPYFATSLPDFWRRWHISLSTWFRDYLYIPMGGNRRGLTRTCFNLFIVMLLAGLWHGARFNFVLWGLWHAMGLIACHFWSRLKRGDWSVPNSVGWALTMTWTLVGWMLFRAESIDGIYRYLAALGTASVPIWFHLYVRYLCVLLAPIILAQWLIKNHNQLAMSVVECKWPRSAFQALLLLAIVAFAQREELRPFIYFQF